MRSLAARYGRWQVRDYFLERGVWTAAVGLGLLALFWLNYDPHPDYLSRLPMADRARFLAAEPERFRDSVIRLFTLLGFVGTLIATHGIVARDRERGFHRFLFAKPVDAARFYGQAFVVNGFGLLAVSFGVLLATALAFQRLVPLSALGIVASEFMLFGSLTFLLSALWRFDFVLAALSVPVAGVVSALAHERQSYVVAGLVEPLLPPILRYARFMEAATGPEVVRSGDLLVVFGYSALCFGAALFAIRRRAGARAGTPLRTR